MTAIASDAGTAHHPPVGVYLKVWGWLFALSVASYLVDVAPFSEAWIWAQWTLITGFALVKATLILQFFMHLKSERLALVGAVIALPLFFVVLLVVFLVGDAAHVDEMRRGILGG